jgi:lysophospholipase L1-like esterase
MNRKYIVIIFVLALILGIYFFIPRKQNIKNYPPRNATIVAFGDSLVVGYGATQDRGFVSLLAEKLGKPIIFMGALLFN